MITPGSKIEQNLNQLMETRIAGDPDDPGTVFTDLTPMRLEKTHRNDGNTRQRRYD